METAGSFDAGLATTLLFASAILYFIVRKLTASLNPPFVALELASTPKHAANVLLEWQRNQKVPFAIIACFCDALLVFFYFAACLWLVLMVHREGKVLGSLSYLVALGIAFAALANWVEDGALVVTLVRGRASESLVALARWFGWIKYSAMAMTIVYFIFRGEVWVFERLKDYVRPHPRTTIGLLGVVTLATTFLIGRRLTLLSRDRPPLLALQFACDRLAARDVLEKWGSRRREAAFTLALDSLLAVLYGVTFATLFESIVLHWNAGHSKSVVDAAAFMAWVAIVAAAFHIGQNLGAFIAAVRGSMGWWVSLMRRVGWMRYLLLLEIGLYFIVVLVDYEAHKLTQFVIWIATLVRK